MQNYSGKDSSYFSVARTDIEELLPARLSDVLEIGCGDGSTLEWLRRTKGLKSAVGIELFPEAAAIAATRLDKIYTGNAESLISSIAPEPTFDLVLCLDVLEHLVDPWDFVGRLEKLIRPGGLLIGSIPNARHYSLTFPLLFGGRWDYAATGILDRTHLRFFTRKSAIELMSTHTLQVVQCVPKQPPPGSKANLLLKMTFGAAVDIVSLQYLIAARKSI